MVSLVPPLMDWRADAACAELPKEMFYPARGSGVRYRYEEARQVCLGCPVRQACLAAAMEAEGTDNLGYRHGMFGGLTPRERHQLAVPRTCEVCGRRFSGRTFTCSDLCQKIKLARYKREWAQRHGHDPNRPKHGRTTGVNAGCKCAACSGHRRTLKREARMRAMVREWAEMEAAS